jgi:hypothetical protein
MTCHVDVVNEPTGTTIDVVVECVEFQHGRDGLPSETVNEGSAGYEGSKRWEGCSRLAALHLWQSCFRSASLLAEVHSASIWSVSSSNQDRKRPET